MPPRRAFPALATGARKPRRPIGSSIERVRISGVRVGSRCGRRTGRAWRRTVLYLQDTTEPDFNGQAIDGLGRLSYEAQRGLYVPPTCAVSPRRLPLGILDAWMGTRPLDRVESRRWIEAYERLAECAGRLPDTRRVHVADREADLLEWMQGAHALSCPADYLLRAQHNRRLPEGGKPWPTTLAPPCMLENIF